MLKVAVPNKGSLAETAALMLQEAGYEGRREARDLHSVDVNNQLEFFYLRPRDIATYVGSGALDVGITGRDLLLDSGSKAKELQALSFANSTFRFAGPVGVFSSITQFSGKRIATSYPGLVGNFLKNHGVTAELVSLDGAVESAVKLGVADAIADVVSTGNTLRAAGLEIVGPVILESEAILIGAGKETSSVRTLERRLNGVLVARQYSLMDFDVPAVLLDEACAIAPGIESPTVASLQDPNWLAVRVMVKRSETNKIMDRLYELGARAILVSSIQAARL